MKYTIIIFLLFIINQILAAPYCGFPSLSNSTVNEEKLIKIESCTKFFEYPEWGPNCKTIFEGKLKRGEYFTDEDNSKQNTFVYMGDGSVCYSVYKDFGGCSFIDPSYGCENQCVSSYMTNIYYSNIYDYYSCISKVDSTYWIYIGSANEEGGVSSSNKLQYSILLFLSSLLFLVLL